MNSHGKRPAHAKDRGLWLIVFFKFLHVLVLLAVALGALHMLNHDISDFAENLVSSLGVDPDNTHIQSLLEKLELVSAKQLKELSIGSFIYAAITLTEGVGLAMRRRWAEYFTIIITASFLPLEIYEIVQHARPVKFLLLAINLAILGYLVAMVRRKTES